MSDIIIQEPALVELTVNDSLETVTLNITDAIQLTDYIPKNTINAKGDLIIGDQNAEPVRMPIGSPNYFMVVDPMQDRGYKFTNTIDGGTF